MAGLLAWAADVVGGTHSDPDDRFPSQVLFSPEQEKLARELDDKAAVLRRSIHDLRRRIPPSDISLSLPHLHAHSLASNAALALQLNAHSSTRQQVQLREEALQEENAAYEKGISVCKKKIEEKSKEAILLQNKLKEMELAEKELKAELEKNQSRVSSERKKDSMEKDKVDLNPSPSKNILIMELEEKKNELATFEAMVLDLEGKWDTIQHESLRQPSPAQREKALEKQLHGLIEQLSVKQAQAEALVGDVKAKELELERLNAQLRRMEAGKSEEILARNRFLRNHRGESSSSYMDQQSKHYYLNGGRLEREQKPVIIRSVFLLYILALQMIVFIKLSF